MIVSEGVLKVIFVNPSEPRKSEASKLNRKWINNFLIEVILEQKILKSLLFTTIDLNLNSVLILDQYEKK